MTAPELSFPTANGRYYQHPAKQVAVPSVTNITGKKDKPGLKYWAAKMAATYASENRAMLATLSPADAYTLVRAAPFEHKDDSPSAIGDIVHDWIDNYVKTAGAGPTSEAFQAAPITARRMWEQFQRFTEHYTPQFIESEFSVWSDTYGYAGSADLFMTMGGMNILADTKTGNKTYPEVAMQLAALARADFIINPDGTQRPIPAFDRYAVLHIRPMSFSLIPVGRIDEAFAAFLALKTVFDWEINYGDSTLGYAPRVGSKKG